MATYKVLRSFKDKYTKKVYTAGQEIEMTVERADEATKSLMKHGGGFLDRIDDKEPSKFEGMDVEQLKAYAEEHGIEIGNSSSVNGITKKIVDAEKAKANTEGKVKE